MVDHIPDSKLTSTGLQLTQSTIKMLTLTFSPFSLCARAVLATLSGSEATIDPSARA